MKLAFLHSDKPRERLLADAFLLGARTHGHETEAIALGTPYDGQRYDVACMVGVKSREVFAEHHKRGAHVIYLDKGYARHKKIGVRSGWEFWRVAIDAHHPTDRLGAERHAADRFERLELDVAPWRERGEHIILAGSSAKYHAFYGLKEPTTYARGLVREIREHTRRPLVYRPKPSWKEAVEIKKARYSRPPESIGAVLKDAHALVTHGSNACFEAMLAGIPTVALGPAVAAPISSTDLSEIEEPRLASEKDRYQLLHNLAYWQWTEAEMASGEAWETIGKKLHA